MAACSISRYQSSAILNSNICHQKNYGVKINWPVYVTFIHSAQITFNTSICTIPDILRNCKALNLENLI